MTRPKIHRIPIIILIAFSLALAPATAQEILWRPLLEEGNAALEKGDLGQAERQLTAALTAAEQFGKGDARLATTLESLAKVYCAEEKYDEAEKLAQRVVEICQSKADAGTTAGHLLSLGRILCKEGKFSAAQTEFDRAIGMLRKEDGNAQLLATLLIEESSLYQEAGSPSKAEPLLLEALRLEEESGASAARSVSTLEKLAAFYMRQSRLSEAQPLFKKAITLRERDTAGKDPAIIKDFEQLGVLYQKQGKSEDAEQLLKQAVSIADKNFGQDNLLVADELTALGRFLVDEDRTKEAVPYLQRALVIRTKMLKDSDPKIADNLVILGNAYANLDDYVQAEKTLKMALSIDEQLKGQSELRIANDHSQLGRLYLSQGKYDQAEAAYKKALDLTSKLRGADHPETATSMNNLAFMYRNQGRYAPAEQLLRQALSIRQKAYGQSHPMVAQNLINLGDVLTVQEKYPDAEEALLKAFAIDEKALGPDHDYVALILRDLIDVLRAQNKSADAETYARKLLARDERTAAGESMVIAGDLNLLAKLLIAQEKTSEAKDFKKRANDIQSKVMKATTNTSLENKLVPPSAAAMRPVKDKWALVIGISTFQDNNLNLKYAAKDATDFRNFLINQEHFKPDHIKLVTDKEATRANIVHLLGDGWMRKVINQDDLAVIYISSHGSQARKEIGGANFIVPYEGNLHNIVFSGIPMQWLTVGLKDMVHCDRLCVFLDVCHGGAAGAEKSDDDLETNAPERMPIAEEGFKGIKRETGLDPHALRLGSGQVVVAASQADQVSWESKRYANGVFTRRLMEGLRSRGENTTLNDAYDYLKDMVEEEVLRDRGELQTPVIVPRASKDFEPELACKTASPRAGLDTSSTPSPSSNSPLQSAASSGQKQPASAKDSKATQNRRN